MQIGPLGDGIVYILAWFWSRDSQVRKSPPHRKSLKYSHTHTLRRKHTDGPQKSSHNTALVVCLVCLGVSEVCVCCVCSHANSVAHLLGYFVRIEDARHRHLQLVFLLLGLTQRSLPLLQKQVRGVLACEFLQVHRERFEHFATALPERCCLCLHLTHTLCPCAL